MSSMLDKAFKNNLNSYIVVQQSKVIFKKLNICRILLISQYYTVYHL